MLDNMEKLLVAVLLLTLEGETFCTVYMKTLLLMHQARIDTPSLVKIRWKKQRSIAASVKSLNHKRNRALVTELLQRHYTETTTNHSTTHLLHRKLKLSKYIRRQKANKDMAAKLKSKFGNDVVFAISNYSAPDIRCQQPSDNLQENTESMVELKTK
ncbi:hypothetical protein G6F43_012547 [Rhizopus delemar]|nr:hypothetical protein G6F43_012547 [Rhizopus delemar]